MACAVLTQYVPQYGSSIASQTALYAGLSSMRKNGAGAILPRLEKRIVFAPT